MEADVRVIAATNRDLQAEMKAQRFRPDLYYRLAVVMLNVPPLRERREDILGLAQTFLEHFCRQFGGPVKGIHPAAMEALGRYDWPGNVRELMNVVERAVLLCPGPEIHLEDLRRGRTWIAGSQPTGPSPAVNDEDFETYFEQSLGAAKRSLTERFEKAYLSHLLKETRGRVWETAQRAGLSERTLYGLMKRYGLKKEEFKRSSDEPDNRVTQP